MLSALITLVVFFLILGILVFVHELGHFAVAKWAGMRVDEFALGFPPRIFARKKGETTYALNAIPFGGYVKIHGESPDSEEEDPRSFNQKGIFARIAVIVAGVAMNVLFAFVVLVIAFSVGFASYAQDLSKISGAKVSHSEVVVVDVLEGSPAQRAGIEPGDTIVGFVNPMTSQLDAVSTPNQLVEYTGSLQKEGIASKRLEIERDGVSIEKDVEINLEGPALGISISASQLVRIPFWHAPAAAFKEMGFIVDLTWDALKGFGRKLFYSAELDPNVSGPVGIYQATGAATQQGIIPTVFLAVALSLNLALLNILPIPALDGGRLLFLLIELVFGKKAVNRRLEAAVTFAGFVMVMGLILILSVRDVANLF